MKQFISIQPHDIVNVSDRFWKVTGVYLGALQQENVVGLVAVDGQRQNGELIVPLDLIPGTSIFRGVDHEALKHGVGSAA